MPHPASDGAPMGRPTLVAQGVRMHDICEAIGIFSRENADQASFENEPQPAEREPEAPDWLSEPARAVWGRVIEDLELAGIAFRMDTDTIAAYCSSVALLAEAERALAEGDGPIKADRDGTERRNPWLLVRQTALDGVHRFGSMLGMSPAARTHLGVTMRARTPEDDLAERLLSH